MADIREDVSRSPRRGAATELSPAAACGLSLQGKKVLITGGSKGIGLETARLFVDLGAEIAICARSEQDLQSAKQSMSKPDLCHTISIDISTQAGIQTLMAQLPFEHLDVLVNNAGINIRKRVEDYEADEFAKVFNTNFMSCYWLSTAALPYLRRANDGASIVNLSSIAACSHIPSGTPYAVSKAAMDQMTRNLSVEWARFGIRVNSIAPGPIQTPLVAQANQTYIAEFKRRIPMQRIGSVKEVARPIAFFASDASSYITGQTLYVDGGFLATSFNEIPGFWEDAGDAGARPN